MTAAPATVRLVDDDASVRDAVTSLLRSVGHAVEAFATAEALLAAPPPPGPLCLVIDVRLPGTGGLALQRRLLALGDDRPIVFISAHGDVPMTVEAMKRGAIEFLTKPFRDQELIDAVDRGVALDRARLADAAALAAVRGRHAALTPREREVMAHVTAGLANKEVAARLGLSEITVKVHRANVMRKMEARSLPDLVRMADALAGARPFRGDTSV